MGNKAVELMKKGKHVFFAFEEAIGLLRRQTNASPVDILKFARDKSTLKFTGW